jgi:hypothetical protein
VIKSFRQVGQPILADRRIGMVRVTLQLDDPPILDCRQQPAPIVTARRGPTRHLSYFPFTFMPTMTFHPYLPLAVKSKHRFGRYVGRSGPFDHLGETLFYFLIRTVAEKTRILPTTVLIEFLYETCSFIKINEHA